MALSRASIRHSMLLAAAVITYGGLGAVCFAGGIVIGLVFGKAVVAEAANGQRKVHALAIAQIVGINNLRIGSGQNISVDGTTLPVTCLADIKTIRS